MVIFYSYVSLPEGTCWVLWHVLQRWYLSCIWLNQTTPQMSGVVRLVTVLWTIIIHHSHVDQWGCYNSSLYKWLYKWFVYINISRNKYVTYNDDCNISNQHPIFEGLVTSLPPLPWRFFWSNPSTTFWVPKSLWEHRDVKLGGHRLLLIR